jgi:hypothetical protein
MDLKVTRLWATPSVKSGVHSCVPRVTVPALFAASDPHGGKNLSGCGNPKLASQFGYGSVATDMPEGQCIVTWLANRAPFRNNILNNQ